MPSLAILVPGGGGDFSMPIAMVVGNETEPVLPRVSSVEKSFCGSSSSEP
jgi:hypothetical protein